eukprot:m.277744 g.277744  ORF g.277744 m.277744 type:complete len:3260 (-) comp17712_c0_seq2:2323-12102(-)
MPCCGSQSRKAKRARRKREQSLQDGQAAAAPSASNDAIELEEDPTGLTLSPQNSGQNVLSTAFSADGTSEQTYTHNVLVLHDKSSKVDQAIASHYTAVIAALQRATEHMTVVSNECDSAHEMSSTLEGHLGPDCVNDVARTVFNLSQARGSADVATESLSQAVSHLKEAGTISRDFASDFDVLESQSRAGAFGQAVHTQEERPDTRWTMAAKPVVTGMADEFAALQTGLEQLATNVAAVNEDATTAQTDITQVQAEDGEVKRAAVAATTSELSGKAADITANLARLLREFQSEVGDFDKLKQQASTELLRDVLVSPQPFAGPVANHRVRFQAAMSQYTMASSDATQKVSALEEVFGKVATEAQNASLEAAAIPSENLSESAQDQQAKVAARLPQLAESGHSTVESLADQKTWQTAVQACDEVVSEQASLVTKLIAAPSAAAGREVQAEMKKAVANGRTVAASLTPQVSQAAQIATSSAEVQQVAAKEVIDALLANPAGLWEADPANDGAAQAGYAYAAQVGATATSLRNTRDHAQSATNSAAALSEALEAVFAASEELSAIEPEMLEPPVGKRTVKLVKDEQGLGLKLRSAEGCRGTRVDELKPGTVAHKSGLLKPGDAICSINGTPVHNSNHNIVVDLLKDSDEIELEVDDKFPAPRMVLLKRSDTKGLGLGFATHEEGPIVTHVVPESPAATTREIYPEDHILQINDVPAMDLNHDQVLAELQRYAPYVQLMIGPDFETQVPAELKESSALDNIASYGGLDAEGQQALAEKAKEVPDPLGDSALDAVVAAARTIQPPDDADADMRTVTFDKSKPLGLRLKSDEDKVGVYVLEKVEGSQAAAEPNIKDNDFVHKINGEDVSSLSHDEIVQHIVDSEGEVSLTVSTIPPDDTRTVTFDRSKPLGLRLKSDDDLKGVYVLEKVEGSQGAAEPNVREKDFIHAVNGQDVSKLSHDDVVELILECVGRVTLTVSANRPAAHPLAKIPEAKVVEESAAADNAQAEEKAVTPPAATATDESAEDGTMTAQAEKLLKSLPGAGPSAGHAASTDRTVTFDKSKGSLGLRLKSEEDAPGVRVLEKVEGTQAADKPDVHVGDYVRAINGQDADTMSHEQVIATIVAAEGLVDIRLSSDAPPAVVEATPDAATVEAKTTEAAAAAAAPRSRPISGDHDLSVIHDRDTTLVVVERKPDEGFGLRLGTFDEPGVQVVEVIKGSPADKTGEFLPGQKLLKIDERDVSTASHEEIIDHLRSRTRVELLMKDVEHEPEVFGASSSEGGARPTLDVADLDAELPTYASTIPKGEREVTIVKKANRGFGLKLATDEDTNVTTILDVVEGGAAADTQALYRNDNILAINGANAYGVPHEEIMRMLQESGSAVTLKVANGDVAPPNKGPAPQRLNIVVPRGNDGYGMKLITSDDESQQGASVLEVFPGKAADKAGVKAGDRLVNVNGVDVSSKSHTEIIDVMRNADSLDLDVERSGASGRRTVRIQRVAGRGFGMKLATEDDVTGTTISDLLPGGLAAETGLLKAGDAILEINGQSVASASHAEVVQALQSSNDIVLEVDDSFPPGARRSLVEEPASRDLPNGNGTAAASGAVETAARSSSPAAETASGPIPPLSATTTCRVHRGQGQRFGMKLLEQEDQPGSGVVVNGLEPEGAAALGGLKVGDRFYSIDGTVVWNGSHNEVLGLFRDKADMDIKVVRPPHEAAALAAARGLPLEQQPVPQGSVHRRLTVSRKDGEKIGLKLASTDDGTGGATVSAVVPGGAAEPAGLKPGDLLASINGVDVRDRVHSDIVGLFAEGEEFDIEVYRPAYLEQEGFHATTLMRQPGESYGLRLVTEEQQDGVSIGEKMPGTPAAENDVLQAGDHLINVNGVEVEHATHDDIVALLTDADIANLVVRRKGTSPATTAAGHLRAVTLSKSDGQTLGMKLRTDDAQIGAYVQEVLPEGVAATKGIHAGDRILFINNQDVRNATHDEVVAQLVDRDIVTLVLEPVNYRKEGRARIVIPHRVGRSFGFKLRTDNDATGGVVFEIFPNTSAAASGLQLGDRLLSINGIPCANASHAEMVKLLTRAQEPLVLEVESGSHFFEPADVNPAPPAAAATYRAPNVRSVTLVKDKPMPFGFQVASTSSGHGARVSSVVPGGLAEGSKQIKANDAVLAINGQSMLYASMDEIEDALRVDPSNISIVVADEFPEMEEIPVRMERTPGTSWGMSLRAFDDKPGTVVRDVTQGGVAAQAGIQADDLIFQVNDDDLSDALHADVLKAIAASEDTMLVAVRRPRSDELAPAVEAKYTATDHLAHSGAGPAPASSAAAPSRVEAFPGGVRPDGIVRHVNLTKTDTQPIGMQIAADDDGVVVQSVSPTGSASASGIKANDKILSLNGVDATAITENEIADALGQSSDVDVVVTDRPLLFGRQPSRSDDTTNELRAFRLRRGPAGYGMTLQTRHVDNLTYVASVTEDSPAAEAGIEPHDVILINNGTNLEHADDETVLKSITSSDQSSLVLVRHMERSAKLQQGNAGYGLTLIKPESGKGAIVAGTLVASPAATSGALFGGDKLVSLDGHDANDMPFEQILDQLQTNPSVDVTVAPAAAIREESIGTMSPLGNSTSRQPTPRAETTFDLNNASQTQSPALAQLEHQVRRGEEQRALLEARLAQMQLKLATAQAERDQALEIATGTDAATGTEDAVDTDRAPEDQVAASAALADLAEGSANAVALIEGTGQEDKAVEANARSAPTVDVPSGSAMDLSASSPSAAASAGLAEALAKAQEEHEQTRAELAAATAKMEAERQAAADAARAEAQAEREKAIQAVEAAKAQELADLKAAKTKEIAELEAVKAKELADLEAAKAKELAELQSKFETDKATALANASAGGDTAQQEAIQGAIAAASAEKETAIAALQAEKAKALEEAEAKHAAAVEEAVAKANADVAAQHEAALAEEKAKAEKAGQEQVAATLTKAQEEKEQAVLEAAEKARAEAQEELAALKTELETAKAENALVVAAGDKDEGEAARVAELQKEVEEAKAAAAAAAVEVDALKEKAALAVELDDKLQNLELERDQERQQRQALEIKLAEAEAAVAVRADEDPKQAAAELQELEELRGVLDAEKAQSQAAAAEVEALRKQLEEAMASKSQLEQLIESASTSQVNSPATSPRRRSAASQRSASPRSTSPRAPKYRAAPNDPLDRAVGRVAMDLGVNPDQIKRVAPSKYRFFGDSKTVSTRSVGKKIVVRIGGGWQDLREYLQQHQGESVATKDIDA